MKKTFDHKALEMLRLRRGLSKSDAAKLIYCTNEAYYAFESGREVPSDWWLGRIARALMYGADDPK